jgi:hypothetical protein
MRSIARTPQLPLQSLEAPTGHSFARTRSLQPREGQTTAFVYAFVYYFPVKSEVHTGLFFTFTSQKFLPK